MLNNTIFIHVAPLDRYTDRLNYYLDTIEKSFLHHRVDTIFICFVGNSLSIDRKYSDELSSKLKYVKVSNDIKDYELPTLKFLYDYCNINPNNNILYIHTKGVGHEINPCIEDWVNYMVYFLIERFDSCLEILKDYSTCGVDLRDYPILHYSGNFWWAKAAYIKSLPDPVDFSNLQKYPNPLNSQRHNQEFWICYNKNMNLHRSMWDCGINCFERHLHRYLSENYK